MSRGKLCDHDVSSYRNGFCFRILRSGELWSGESGPAQTMTFLTGKVLEVGAVVDDDGLKDEVWSAILCDWPIGG